MNKTNLSVKSMISRVAFLILASSVAACTTSSSNNMAQGTTPSSAQGTTPSSNHMAQGLIYVNQQDFDSAIIEFEAEIAKNPSAEAYINIGAAYMQLGKTNLALNALKQGEELNAGSPILNYNLMALYSILDKTDIALVYLDKTLERGFNNYDALRFDPDLSNLRSEPEFRTTLEKYKIFLQ